MFGKKIHLLVLLIHQITAVLHIANNAAENIQPFTFHQIPPLTTSLVSGGAFI